PGRYTEYALRCGLPCRRPRDSPISEWCHDCGRCARSRTLIFFYRSRRHLDCRPNRRRPRRRQTRETGQRFTETHHGFRNTLTTPLVCLTTLCWWSFLL